MSSHREAPESSKDPVADSTDVYAFVSPDKTDTVTLIANYLPLQQANGGPNFYEFGDDVQYDIKISYDSDTAGADLIYRFRFTTKIRNDNTFLYNTGVIDSPTSKAWNRPQTYSVTKIDVRGGGKQTVLATGLTVPPCNVGVRSTPNYADIAAQAVHKVGNRTFFAGQRADAFRVDLGSVFDLGGLRPLNSAHLIPLQNMDGINAVKPFNVHSIAMQLPLTELNLNGNKPTNVQGKRSVIGVWTTASRQQSRMYNKSTYRYEGTGPFVPVTRLANPLVNELLIPMASKDKWNNSKPEDDKQFNTYIVQPELAKLLPVLYPDKTDDGTDNGPFANLAAYTKDRADLQAIFHTGIPYGVVKDADGNPLPFATFTSTTLQEMVRLNLAIPSKQPGDDGYSVLGVIGGDLAGFPNGRRPADDVTTIELRAVAGATIPLVDPDYNVDSVVGSVKDGSYDDDNTDTNEHTYGNLNAPLLDSFPYLGHPGGGYQTTTGFAKSTSDGYGGSTGSPSADPRK